MVGSRFRTQSRRQYHEGLIELLQLGKRVGGPGDRGALRGGPGERILTSMVENKSSTKETR